MGIVLLLGATAHAQQGTGVLQGTIIDEAGKKPLIGVVVTVKSPALQEAQVAFTDDSGFYRVPGLPPGVYSVNFDMTGYFPNERGGIQLRSDATLRINSVMRVASGQAEDIVINVRPTVDVGSSTSSTTIDKDLLRRVPVAAPGGKGAASRSFESVAEVAPGASGDTYGTSLNGSTSPENHYSVDGLSVGNPGKGTVGTALSTEFVEEVKVVSAGYMPEFGRATGGIINVVTKSGSNKFSGEVYGYLSPGSLEGARTPVLRDATPVAYKNTLSYIGDAGFNLGGPIIKDKLWFFTGFQWSSTKYNVARSIHRTVGVGTPDEQIEGTPLATQNLFADSTTMQAMAKLTYSVNADNRVSLSVFGAPTRSGGGAKFDGTNITPGGYAIDPLTGRPESGGSGTYGSTARQFSSTPIDAQLKWNSQFLDKRLLLDVMAGAHFQTDTSRAADGSSATSGNGLGSYYHVNWRRSDPNAGGFHSITEFENFANSQKCNEAGASCKVDSYSTGAPYDLSDAKYNRYHGSMIVSYLASLWGHHLLKAGIDGEMTSFENTKSVRVFTESSDGSQFDDEERFGLLTGPDQFSFIDPLRKKTSAMTIGGFVQDSWSVADKITLNVGVRYDAQYFYNTAGNIGLSLPNQWSPRLGLIYDPTQQGKSKLFVNYARYFENAPLGFADVVLVGEPQIHGGHVCNPLNFNEQKTTCQEAQNLRKFSQDNPRLPNKTFTAGGLPGILDPSIEASSSDEISGGAEYELLPDARVGATYTRRWINKWIEDMNPVAGLPGFAGNPGFGLGDSFPKVQRNYSALTLFLVKNFSRSWLAQASYTIASLRGNYNGLFAPEDDYLGPNGTADFDSPNVIFNRYGALRADYRHNIKVLAAKDWAILPTQHLSTGLNLRARSGGATSYLATDPNTYENETYLLERGSGKRLPWTYGADLSLSYRVANLSGVGLTLTADIFNLFNFQQVVSVNETYTHDNVIATDGYKGKPEDIKNTDGGLIGESKSPSFGQATGYQEPRVFRFGVRGEF